MRELFRNFMLLGFSAILSLGVVGCMKTESKIDKMVAYINDKYSDHFEYSAPFGGGVGATSTQIVVKSKGFPNAQIWVECYTQNGKEFFTDNYVDYKYETQTRDALQNLMESVFNCDIKINFGVGTKGARNDFTDETTFEEYIASRDAKIGFSAVVSNEKLTNDRNVIEQRLKEGISGLKIVTYGTIYLATDLEQFDGWGKIPSSSYSSTPRLYFHMSSPNEFDAFDWGN